MSDENLIAALTERIANEETPKKFIKIYDDELKERRRQRVTSDALDMEETELIAAIADALTNEQDTRRALYEAELQKRRDIRSKVPNMTNDELSDAFRNEGAPAKHRAIYKAEFDKRFL